VHVGLPQERTPCALSLRAGQVRNWCGQHRMAAAGTQGVNPDSSGAVSPLTSDPSLVQVHEADIKRILKIDDAYPDFFQVGCAVSVVRVCVCL